MTQIRRGLIDYFILSVLSVQESYGYQILKDLSEMGSVSVTESTLYPALARLKREGYLSMRKIRSEQGPSRNYYSVTRLGESHRDAIFAFWKVMDTDIRSLARDMDRDGAP